MPSDDIFRILLIVLLLTNGNESGDFTSVNETVIAALLLMSCGGANNNCSRDRGCGCGCNNSNVNTSF
ncbi:MAG: hypothetical protein HFK08_08135 [Clostridia bacterium]|jgi:hypothetical protein|nr:hypothetical protein [Clostridia bacterium]